MGVTLGGWSFSQNIPLVLLNGLLSGETQPGGTVIVGASDDAVAYEIEGFTEEVEIPTQFAEYLERIGSIDEMLGMGIMSEKVGNIVKATLSEAKAKHETPVVKGNSGKGKGSKEKAFQFFDELKRPGDPELKALGIKLKSIYRYYQEWKKARNQR